MIEIIQTYTHWLITYIYIICWYLAQYNVLHKDDITYRFIAYGYIIKEIHNIHTYKKKKNIHKYVKNIEYTLNNKCRYYSIW